MSLNKFRRIWALLPKEEQKLPILVIDDKEITWERAHKEIAKNTELGKKIQKKLEKLNLI